MDATATPTATATSPDQNKATLAILSGSKIVVWDLSTSIGDMGNHPGDDDFRTFDPYPRYDNGLPMSALAWNHNQMVIATSSAISTDDCEHDNIVLLSSQTGETLQSFQHDSEWKQGRDDKNSNNNNNKRSVVRSVSFGGKSRYLCIGDESGAVHLWDLKKKIPVRQFLHAKPNSGASFQNGSGFQSSSPSNQVSLDPTHTYVLSLSPSALYVYKLREVQLAGTFTLPANEDGIDIDVAHFTIFSVSDPEPNLCAIGTDDGRIYIHDIENNRNRKSSPPHIEMTQRHSGDVTGLAFSPVRSNVLFSCGKDGTVFWHDIVNNTSRKIRGALESNNSSIRSMSLHANGDTCAIGCESGDVFVYAFQNGTEEGEVSTTLLASFQANEPIRSLFFAPPPRQKDKQRQQDKTNNNENGSESRSGAMSQNPPSQSTTPPLPMDSGSSGQPPDPKKIPGVISVEPSETVEPRVPATGPAAAGRSRGTSARSAVPPKNTVKPRHPSPFARRLASLSSAAKRTPGAKPQTPAAVDAGTGKRVAGEKVVRSPAKRLPASPVRKHITTRIQAGEAVQTADAPTVGETNVRRNRIAHRSGRFAGQNLRTQAVFLIASILGFLYFVIFVSRSLTECFPPFSLSEPGTVVRNSGSKKSARWSGRRLKTCRTKWKNSCETCTST